MLRVWYGFILFIVVGCSSDNPIQDILSSSNPAIQTVVDSLERYDVQIIYTQIDSVETGLSFTDYSYQTKASTYFYPASTVKFPAALLAAEYVANHPELTIDTPYTIERDSLPHTLAEDIENIFTVSDNEAYNRLYELLGRDNMNKRLRQLGLTNSRIAHRLATANASKNSRRKITLYPSYEGEVIVPDTTPDRPIKSLTLKKMLKGKGHIKEGKLIDTPLDFSLKNWFSLEDQHQLMKQFFFPEEVKKKRRVQLKPSEELRIKSMMAKLPRDAGFDPKMYYDSYGKFFMYGDTKDTIPSHIKIYNKVGYAYGTLTETAYIVDHKEGIQFILSATLLVNNNKIFNDDRYEYDSIGIPFLAQLGRELHQYTTENKIVLD